MTPSQKTILVADDDKAIRYVLEQSLKRSGYQVYTFERSKDLLDFMEAGSKEVGDLVITDIVMPAGSGLDLMQTLRTRRPNLPVIVITAQSTLNNAVHAFERGAFEYLAKPFDIKQVITLVGQALEQTQQDQPRQQLAKMARFDGFVGSSQAMQELFRTIGKLSNSEMIVLIHGESGTGKELVARAVHDHSPRRHGPFTAINMAAIPADLIESELFGHEKGAFTGASTRRQGHFERAGGGTLFLDEIGDMPMQAQTRLLRILQNGVFTRVGGTETLRTDVRIVAATHQNLPAAITAGRFREDLFYRLNVVPLYVPSLRSRREDIPLLTDYFLARAAQKMGVSMKRLSKESRERFMVYDWPGNVRELENLVQRLTVLSPHEQIQLDDLDLPSGSATKTEEKDLTKIRDSKPPLTSSQLVDQNPTIETIIDLFLEHCFSEVDLKTCNNIYDLSIHKIEKALFEKVLFETRGNRVKAALMLGINRNTLRKKVEELGVETKR